MTPYIDALGNPVTEGARFVYPVRRGSSSMEFGRGVIEVVDPCELDIDGKPIKYKSQKPSRYGSYAMNAPMKWVGGSARWEIVPGWLYRIKFRPLTDDFKPKTDSYLRTLHTVDRIIVVDGLL